MWDDILRSSTSLAVIIAVGFAIAAVRPRYFAAAWFSAAAALIVLHALLVTRLYGLVPSPLAGIEQWNWSGKLAASAVMVAIACLPAFGWKRSGLSLSYRGGDAKTALIVAVIVCAYYVLMAAYSPEPAADAETVYFQWTIPGIEEEIFYRGVLLFALNQAFLGRANVLGAAIGWGGLLVSLLFALDHAIAFSHGNPSFKPLTFMGTGLPGLMFLWFRERSGGVALPAFVHNFGNAAAITL